MALSFRSKVVIFGPGPQNLRKWSPGGPKSSFWSLGRRIGENGPQEVQNRHFRTWATQSAKMDPRRPPRRGRQSWEALAGSPKSDQALNLSARSRNHRAQQGFPHPRGQNCDRGRQYYASCWRGEKCERGRIFGDPESQGIKGVGCKKFGLDPGSGMIGATKRKTIRKSRFGPGLDQRYSR